MSKKYIGAALAFCTVFSFALAHGQTATQTASAPQEQQLDLSVVVNDLSTDGESYRAGDTVSISFKLKNATNYYVDSAYYELNVYKHYADASSAAVFVLDGTTLLDSVRSGGISFIPQGEKSIEFSYRIPNGAPASDFYYVQINAFSAREVKLSSEYQKISISNTGIVKWVTFDAEKSRVYGENRAFGTQEGPTFTYEKEYEPKTFDTPSLSQNLPSVSNSAPKPPAPSALSKGLQPLVLKNQVKIQIPWRNSGVNIAAPKARITTYRYGSPLKALNSKDVDWGSVPKDSLGDHSLLLDLPQEPGSYNSVVQLFDGNEKVSNPVAFRYVVAGDNGLISSFLVEKINGGDYVLNLIVAGSADSWSRAAATNSMYQIAFKAAEEKSNKSCFEKTSDVVVSSAGTGSLRERFSISSDCKDPIVFDAQLLRDGKIIDSQSVSTESPDKGGWFTFFSLPLVIAIIAIIAIIVFAILFLKKKNKNIPPTLPPAPPTSVQSKPFAQPVSPQAPQASPMPPVAGALLFFIVFFVSFFFGADKTFAFGTPTLLTPADGVSLKSSDVVKFSWTRPSGFAPNNDPNDTNRSWYEIVFVKNGADIWTSEKIFAESYSMSLPIMDVSVIWRVVAKKGTENISQSCENLYETTICTNSYYYTVSESQYSDTRSITETPATYGGSPDLSAFAGWDLLTDSASKNGWSTVRFNGSADSNPSDAGFSSGYISHTFNYDQIADASYDSTQKAFILPSDITSLPVTSYNYAYVTCSNITWYNYLNYFIIDDKNNIVKRYSDPGFYFYYRSAHSATDSVSFNLPISGLTPGKKYALVAMNALYLYNYDDDGVDARWYTYAYAPFILKNTTLTVNIAGTGNGAVSSADGKINCTSPACKTQSAAYSSPLVASLTAVPDSLSEFAGWSGDAGSATTPNFSVNKSGDVAMTATFNSAVPSAPTNLKVTPTFSCPGGTTSVLLTWQDNASNETYFEIEYKRPPSVNNFTSLTKINGANSSIASVSFSATEPTVYRIRACNSSLCSAYSNEITFTPVICPPVSLIASAGSCSQASLNWADSSDNEAGFKVQRAAGSNGPWGAEIDVPNANSSLASNTSRTVTWTDSTVSQNTTYYYRAYAYRSGITNSAYSIVASIKVPPCITASTAVGLVAYATSPIQNKLSWFVNIGPKDYFKLYKWSYTYGFYWDCSGWWCVPGYGWHWNTLANYYGIFGTDKNYKTSNTSWQFYDNGIGEGNTGVKPETYYLYQIAACNNSGSSCTYSNSVNVVTPSTPTLTLTANPVNITCGGSSQLAWSATNVNSCNATGDWSGQKSASGNETLSGIQKNSSYTLTCYGYNSQASKTVSVTTNCSQQISGSCAATHYNCATGTSSNGAQGSTAYTWSCTGVNGGATVPCSEAIVTAPAASTALDPECSLVANPADIKVGQSSTLTWSCDKANSYSGTVPIGEGLWSGTPKSVSTGPLSTAGEQPYQLTCFNSSSGKTSPICRKTVIVYSPQATITANPTRVSPGGSSKIDWIVSDVSNCSIKKNGSAWKSGITAPGSSSADITGQTTFVLSCTDKTGIAMDPRSVTVDVSPSFQEF